MKNKLKRCIWCGTDPLYIQYHDLEWGKKVLDDKILFEFLVLESAQAGLSWITILRKREGYRRNFAGFDVKKVAEYTEEDIERIVKDPEIIRHRGKIKATIVNAQIFLLIQKEFGTFYNYLYSSMPNAKSILNAPTSFREIPTTSAESVAIAKNLKKRGMKFFGPVTCYAYMQAVGMVNDHETTCSFR